MAVNHKAIRATLKWLTIGIFLIALGHKLYQLYKYGGKVPTEPNETENEVEEQDYDAPVPDDSYTSAKSEYND